MRTPIACALAWPDRLPWAAPRLDLAALGSLTFETPDLQRFPALGLARSALRAGGRAPNVLNAANEIAVAAFVERRIGFLDITSLVDEVLQATDGGQNLATTAGEDVIARRTCCRACYARPEQGIECWTSWEAPPPTSSHFCLC
jgi:1-deoxy-D-xylulose-5-phosphate reductoisomerase